MAIVDDYAAIAKLMKGELKPQPKLPEPSKRKTFLELLQLGVWICGACQDLGWIADPFGPTVQCHACGNPKGLQSPDLRIRYSCIDCLGTGNHRKSLRACPTCNGKGWSHTP